MEDPAGQYACQEEEPYVANQADPSILVDGTYQDFDILTGASTFCRRVQV